MHNKEIKTVEQLAHHRLYDPKRSYNNSYSEKDTNYTTGVTDPSVQQAEAKYVV